MTGATTMNDVSAELLRLIDLNRQERWVPADQALEQLAGHGEALIPGLVAALEDHDDPCPRSGAKRVAAPEGEGGAVER
jgi:hypothetical protein